jgi:primosomal protein N' (replication factor Y)
MFANVVFPLRLPALTYRLVPPHPDDLVGRIVRAPLHTRVMTGVIVEVLDETRAEEDVGHRRRDIKRVESIHERFADGPALKLMTWLSDYYLAPAGLALKVMFFDETLQAFKRGAKPGDAPRVPPTTHLVPPGPMPQPTEVSAYDTSVISACAARREYRTFLIDAGVLADEHALITALVDTVAPTVGGLLVLVPEISRLNVLLQQFREICGDRLAVLHSKLSRPRRIDTIGRILSGESDIILGTRSAVFAPIRVASLIAVVAEHSSSYKAEEGLRYHGRDVAVMRGFLEKCPVVLSSPCPSLESIHNVATKKYWPLRLTAGPGPGGVADHAPSPDIAGVSPHRSLRTKQHAPGSPNVTLVVMRHVRRDEPISREVLSRTKRLLSAGEAVLFLSPRRGYALLRCEECGHASLCPKCRVPLVFYKASGVMRCHHCGREERPPDRCPHCTGFRMQPAQSGTEKVKEYIESSLGTDVRLIGKRKGGRMSRIEIDDTLLSPVIVATAQAGRSLSLLSLGAAVFLDADMLLSRPYFRAGERTFQEVMQVVQSVKPGGTVFVQTAVPTLPLFARLRNLDYHGFARDELVQRRSLCYPPFSRMILFTLNSAHAPGPDVTALMTVRDHGVVEWIGPLEKEPPLRPYRRTRQILLRSAHREALHADARDLLHRLAAITGLRISVDVDPLEI